MPRGVFLLRHVTSPPEQALTATRDTAGAEVRGPQYDTQGVGFTGSSFGFSKRQAQKQGLEGNWFWGDCSEHRYRSEGVIWGREGGQYTGRY